LNYVWIMKIEEPINNKDIDVIEKQYHKIAMKADEDYSKAVQKIEQEDASRRAVAKLIAQEGEKFSGQVTPETLKIMGGAFDNGVNPELDKYLGKPWDRAIEYLFAEADSIQNISQAELIIAFQRKWDELKEYYPYVKPILAFHGTASTNIPNIIHAGLRAPSDDPEINSGYFTPWGKGVYLSPDPNIALAKAHGEYKMLLVCGVLLGRPHFIQEKPIYGASCKPGYHSHVSPDQKEVVIFSSNQILPCYVLHYGRRQSFYVANTKHICVPFQKHLAPQYSGGSVIEAPIKLTKGRVKIRYNKK